MTDDENHFKNFIASIAFDDTPEIKHRDRLEDDLLAALARQDQSKGTVSAWRMVVRSRTTKLVAAVVIAAGIMVAVLLMDKTTAPAYAVEQTIDAIKAVRTVHMAGEFYRQGAFECWLRFDGGPDVPTHMWLFSPRLNLCKICSPAGLFHFNQKTNYIFHTGQDQRERTWRLGFGSFFEAAVQAASQHDSVTLSDEKGFIAVHINRLKREQKILVDAQTKLPVSFSTTWEGAPLEMIKKQALTIKNLAWIRYNRAPPEGIFDVPADAQLVQNDFDCWVDPNAGLVADGMTRQDACPAIVKQTGRALVNMDIDTLCKLNLAYLAVPPEMWDETRRMKALGQGVDELVITGDAYEEGEFWHVPYALRMGDGKREVNTAMIKFYKIEGRTLCLIVGAMAGGVAD